MAARKAPKPAPATVREPPTQHEPLKVGKVDVILAYRNVFHSQEGQIVLADLMRYFSWNMGPMLDLARPDALVLAHRDGQRTVLTHIGRRLEIDPASVEATEETEQ